MAEVNKNEENIDINMLMDSIDNIDFIESDNEKTVHTPLEYGITTLEDFLELKALDYKSTSFINSQRLKYDKSLNIKGHLSRLMQVKNYIARVDINIPKDNDPSPEKSRFITIKPKIAGIVKKSSIILQKDNNRIEQHDEDDTEKYKPIYEIEVINATNGHTIPITINSEDTSNDRLLKSKLITEADLTYSECNEFIANFITKNDPIYVTEYRNSGRIDVDGNSMDWLWGNAAYINGKMHFKNNNRNINIGNNQYIRVKKSLRHLLPKYVPNTKPIEQIIIELFDNIYESWNGAIEPFLALSFMAMSPYCPSFWGKEGFGAVAFIGDTEAGKSEITALGLALFGFDKFFMATTRATVVGIEQKMNSVNCIPVIVDDISKFKMSGDNFCEELKRITSGLSRDKGLTAQESGALPPCCPFGFSSNYLPTEKPEFINRTLYLDTENVKFDPSKFNYFDGKGVKELSCILPSILEVGITEIQKIREEKKESLVKEYAGTSNRMLSQIALALTGIEVFKKLSNGKIKWAEDKLNAYILGCIKRFNDTLTPIDKLLEAMPTLISERRIKSGIEYEFESDNLEILSIYKTQVCQAYNHYYAMEDSKRINSRKIKEVQSENYTIIDLHGSHKYQGKNQNSLILDISKSPYRDEILKAHRGINGYQNNTW